MVLPCSDPCVYFLSIALRIGISLGPKPTQYDVVEMVEVEENREKMMTLDIPYQPRGQRWSAVKQNKHKKLLKVIDINKNFNFRLYNFIP